MNAHVQGYVYSDRGYYEFSTLSPFIGLVYDATPLIPLVGPVAHDASAQCPAARVAAPGAGSGGASPTFVAAAALGFGVLPLVVVAVGLWWWCRTRRSRASHEAARADYSEMR